MTENPKSTSAIREALVVAEYELREMLLSVRSIILLVMYGGAAYIAGAAYLFAAQKAQDQLREQLVNQGMTPEAIDAVLEKQVLSEVASQAGPTFEQIGGDAQSFFEAATKGHIPIVVCVVVLATSFLLPAFILLIGYDRISSDMSHRFVRFLFQRIRRGSYLAGKIAGQTLVVVLVVGIAQILMVGVASLQPDLDVKEILSALPMLFVGTAILSFAYLSFTSVFSALTRSPFLSLASGMMALFGLWILTFWDLFDQVWMGSWDFRLALLQPAAVGIYLAHAAVFLGLSYLMVKRKDT